MKKQIALLTHQVTPQHIQFALTLIALAMLVIGVGAPSDVSGGGPR